MDRVKYTLIEVSAMTTTTDEERLQQEIERRDKALAKVRTRITQLRVLVRRRDQREDRRRLDSALGRRDTALATANARISRLRARIRRRGRREDTRRKILTGAMVLHHVETGKLSYKYLLQEMGRYLTRKGDRALFGMAEGEDPPAGGAAGAEDVDRLQQALGDRGHDTRRKILTGAMLLDQISRGAYPDVLFLALMDEFLSKGTDRALFGLPPLSQQTGDGPGHNNDDDNGRSSS